MKDEVGPWPSRPLTARGYCRGSSVSAANSLRLVAERFLLSYTMLTRVIFPSVLIDRETAPVLTGEDEEAHSNPPPASPPTTCPSLTPRHKGELCLTRTIKRLKAVTPQMFMY